MSENALGKANESSNPNEITVPPGSSAKIFNCEVCGERVKRYPSQITESGVYFCSHQCRAENEKKRSVVECDYCGSKVEYADWLLERIDHYFCDNGGECFNQWQSESRSGDNHPHWNGDNVDTECGWCGESMSVRPHRLRGVDAVFCKDRCFRNWHSDTFQGENAPAWKGGHTKYRGPNWEKQRRRALKRDNHQCSICNATAKEIGRKPDVHHIVRYREFEDYKKANRISNLIALCPFHHGKAESGKISKAELRSMQDGQTRLSGF